MMLSVAHKRQRLSPSYEEAGGTSPTAATRRRTNNHCDGEAYVDNDDARNLCDPEDGCNSFDYDDHDDDDDAVDVRNCLLVDDDSDHHVDDDDDDDDDDVSSFELVLSMCPEVGGIDDGISKLRIAEHTNNATGDEVGEEEGDDTQNHAIDCATRGDNIFLTGKAGTGKSWTSRQIRARLLCKKCLWVVAPTGVAAINVDGMTVHAWGGFGIGSHYSDFDKMMGKETRKKIQKTDVLLFDEISMCDGHFFDVLECMVTIIRRNSDDLKGRIDKIKSQAPVMNENMGGSQHDHDKSNSIMSSFLLKMRWEDPANGGLGDLPPWGGMQIITVGDFFQLPPVPNRARGLDKGYSREYLLENDELYEIEYNNQVGTLGVYTFQSRSWSRSNFRTIELTKIHRQSDSDDGLLKLLNAMREGEKPLTLLHSAAIDAIKAPIRAIPDGIVPTQLRSNNADVLVINMAELSKLDGEPVVFKANDRVEFDQYYEKKVIEKYSLEFLAHSPHIWSSVEGVKFPPEIQEKKIELQKAESKKKSLVEERKYAEINDVDIEIDSLADEIEGLEASTKKKNELNIDNVASWLIEAGIKEESPRGYFDRLTRFDEQLRSDHAKFEQHATERFFARECLVDENFTLKTKSQVMLLYNLELSCKLANGSRGVVEGFVQTEEYRDLIIAIMKGRKTTTTGGNEGSRDCNQSDGIKTTAVSMEVSSTSPTCTESQIERLKGLHSLITTFDDKEIILELVGRLCSMQSCNLSMMN